MVKNLSSMTLQPGGKPLKWLKLRTQGLGSDEVRMWQDLHFSGSATHAMQLILVERILPEQSHFFVSTFMVGLGRQRNAYPF
jgi:hypothetical protein